MKRKDTAIQQQVANLQLKIVQEDKAVENRTTDLLNDWEKTKPVAVREIKSINYILNTIYITITPRSYFLCIYNWWLLNYINIIYTADEACAIVTELTLKYVKSLCLTGNLFHQGNLRPEEALQSLTIYEGNFGRLKDEREKCARAKEALELTDTGLLSGSEERVQVMLAKIHIKVF